MSQPTSSSTRRLASASVWLLLDRFVRMGLGFVVSIFIARYYGPEQWGMLSFVLASATLFGTVATAGGEDLILRDLSKAPTPQAVADIQATTFVLRLVFGAIAYLSLLALVGLSQGFGLPLLLSVVYGLLFLFQASEVWEYRLRVEHRLPVIARTHILTSVASGVVKVGCVLFGWPIAFVTAAMSGEYAANMGILARYRARHWSQWVGRFDRAYAKRLLSSSLLVMFSGLLIVCQTRFEFYLIDYFMGLGAVGQYAAAMKVMELFDMAVVIFSMTLVPELAKRHLSELPVLASRTYLLGFAVFLAMLLPMALIYLIFPWVYGDKYLEAQSLLPWLAFRPLLIILGAIRGMFLVLEGKLRYAPACALVGLICSLSVGWVLVPAYGLVGAVCSGLISLFVSNLLIDAFFQPQNIGRMARSVRELPYVWEKLQQLVKLRKTT